MPKKILNQILPIIIALVWLVNGLFCKILNFVPRHQEIVGHILGDEFARPLTVAIGVGEIVLGILILVKFRPKALAILQIFLVATMNIMEFLLAPEMLLWGKFNSLFALIFIHLVYYYAFVLDKKAA